MTEQITWQQVAKITDISEFTSTVRVDFNGEAVCIYQLESGDIYASQDLCTHGNASLAEGYIEDNTIECPLHQGTFDIVTGEALTAPCKLPLKTYHVKVEGDVIFLGGLR